jgi:hypothetical protein
MFQVQFHMQIMSPYLEAISNSPQALGAGTTSMAQAAKGQ